MCPSGIALTEVSKKPPPLPKKKPKLWLKEAVHSPRAFHGCPQLHGSWITYYFIHTPPGQVKCLVNLKSLLYFLIIQAVLVLLKLVSTYLYYRVGWGGSNKRESTRYLPLAKQRELELTRLIATNYMPSYKFNIRYMRREQLFKLTDPKGSFWSHSCHHTNAAKLVSAWDRGDAEESKR